MIGIEVASAGANKAAAGLRLIDRVKARARQHGQDVKSVCVDRGYSMARLDTWALPLIGEGIVQHHDLGSKESRLAPGPHPGVIFLDGHPYLAVMPKRLKELRRPGLDATADEVAQSARQYNERAPYAFSTNGPVRDNGAQRYRGPVLTKKVRCPNHPESMRWAETKPLTNCTPGEACACSLTFTVQADDRVTKHRQPERYGTENWSKRYGARNLVESFNASLKKHHMKLARHSTRLFGLAKNTIMLGFIVAATNIALLRQRYGYDPAKPHTMPTPGTPLMPLPQKQKSGSNGRHPESPPPEGGPPPPVPGGRILDRPQLNTPPSSRHAQPPTAPTRKHPGLGLSHARNDWHTFTRRDCERRKVREDGFSGEEPLECTNPGLRCLSDRDS